ncbi:MAG: hypothetical protein ACJ0GH_06060 [Alphaproteobacteria bacterium]
MNKFFIVIFLFILNGCALSGLNKDNIVQTTSTAAGGYIGYNLADGDLLTTSVGSTVGLIIGQYLSKFIAQDDYYYFSQETLKTLEINDNNKFIKTGYWKNPKSGNEGLIKIKGYYGDPECRLVEHIFVVGSDNPRNSFNTVCRKESGQWAMVK